MSRHESDREDLMAEATALRERIELDLPDVTEHVVVGFRENGAWSLYFGSDPVFHFDAGGALRRAFVDGELYRSQGTTLARLTRTRTDREVQLVRHDLSQGELEKFLGVLRDHLKRLHGDLESGAARVVQQVPEKWNWQPRLLAALSEARSGRLSNMIRKR